MYDDEHPCPCPACDEFSLMDDEYCTKCIHHNCSVNAPKCPSAKRSKKWCDYCHSEKETVPAHPEADENRVCGDCHQSGSLPDEDNWWKPTVCPDCGTEEPYSNTSSCSSCGYIPEENRA